MAKATRQAFGEALAELGAKHREVVVCDADLSKSTMSCLFAKKFPERFFEFGIQEANMIGAGAGLALAGKRPFVCSFACFLTGRYDTIRMSAAYSNAPLRLVGTHAGIGIGEDGNSQMGLEDMTIMRALPRMMVLQPADERETWAMMEYLCTEIDHPVYLRLTRQKLMDVTPEGYVFKPGQVIELRAGSDVTICATGGTVEGAVNAAGQPGRRRHQRAGAQYQQHQTAGCSGHRGCRGEDGAHLHSGRSQYHRRHGRGDLRDSQRTPADTGQALGHAGCVR